MENFKALQLRQSLRDALQQSGLSPVLILYILGEESKYWDEKFSQAVKDEFQKVQQEQAKQNAQNAESEENSPTP